MKIHIYKISIALIIVLSIVFLPIPSQSANAKALGSKTNATEHRNHRKVTSRAPEIIIKIVAKNFQFTPSTITIKKGVPVVLEFVSQDRRHGFSLRAFGIRTDIKPGGATRVTFTPDRTGTFSFKCDVFCGDGHEDMTGTVVVTD